MGESAWIQGLSLGISAESWPHVVVNIRKDNAMKTTKKTTITIAGYDHPVETVTADWLTARMRNGRRRVEVLGWKRLATIYHAARSGSAIRRAINAEARRCGYTPSTILALNAEE
jgi:hypothetical protein